MAGWWYLTRACPEPVRRAQRHERAVELLVVRGEAELHGRGEELGLQRAHSCRETVRAGRHNSQQEAVPGGSAGSRWGAQPGGPAGEGRWRLWGVDEGKG